MKKLALIVLSIVIISGLFYFLAYLPEQARKIRIAEIKKGWHVEIITKTLNVRETPEPWGVKIGEVKEGQVYEVIEMNFSDFFRFWYKIKINDYKEGWVANPRITKEYLNDINNDLDISPPTLKFFEETYFVKDIESINYDHLEVTDDKDGVVVTHVIYHEYEPSSNPELHKDQYWIVYTATDTSDKKVSKTQAIVFEQRPLKNQVVDFKLFKK